MSHSYKSIFIYSFLDLPTIEHYQQELERLWQKPNYYGQKSKSKNFQNSMAFRILIFNNSGQRKEKFTNYWQGIG